jgi:hypothetical protein
MSLLIPLDFPRESVAASVPGVQPKLLMRLDAATGRFVNGPSDAEVEARYDMCRDLVAQLVAKCISNRGTKYRELSDVQILERLLAQLLGTHWGTEAEMKWVVRQTASELDWTVPDSAMILRTMLGEIE